MGCGVWLEGPGKVKTLALKPILNMALEGNKAVTLVVNTTQTQVKLKQDVLLGLAYDGQVVPEPFEISCAYIGAVDQNSSAACKASKQTSLNSLVKVTDFPEHRDSLLTILHKDREVINLPGASLSATGNAEHYIKLKPETKPVYIPAFTLPYSQTQIVDEQFRYAKTWRHPAFMVILELTYIPSP